MYLAICRRREAERERIAAAKAQAERDRLEGGLWWSNKSETLPVPDHGKLYGNRTVATVHGWGSWVDADFVAAPDETRPAEQRYKHQPLNPRFKSARSLHFRNDAELQEQRASMVAKLLEEDMCNAAAEKSRSPAKTRSPVKRVSPAKPTG